MNIQNKPINPHEEEIKTQLINNGLDEKDLEFRGESERRYIRYNYWKKINQKFLEGTSLTEDVYYDDDGDDDYGRPIVRTLYSYIIN
jgi:hypothetical protein